MHSPTGGDRDGVSPTIDKLDELLGLVPYGAIFPGTSQNLGEVLGASRSLLRANAHWVNPKFDIDGVERNIGLRYFILANPSNLQLLSRRYGPKVLEKILWIVPPMPSIAKEFGEWVKNKNNQNPTVPSEKPSGIATLSQVYTMSQISNPVDSKIRTYLSELLADGEWIKLWDSYYKKLYLAEASDEKKKEIFANWITHGMIMEMPEDCLITFSICLITELDIAINNRQREIPQYLKYLTLLSNTLVHRLQNEGKTSGGLQDTLKRKSGVLLVDLL